MGFVTDEPLAQIVSDIQRFGRKRKLSEPQQEEFEQTVHEPPEEIGIDAPMWTRVFVQKFLRETYGIEYSNPSFRRLLKETGSSYQKPRRLAAKAEESDEEAFHDELQKANGDRCHSSLHRSDQEIRPDEPRASRKPRGTRLTVELSEQRDWGCLLSAITEDGEYLFSRFTEYVTADRAKHFILESCK